ncbi:inositol-3-phosphate synthase [Pyrobaculum neutrophilum]|uniref:Myo-inositol-1-phosphate synthase n=1 Tax=Pyrobaculum neutrophilum (strain DSM 2338 / JCM 9278 / NBRC 100436 / V24Sta) TaxID=444157 RepID=B1YD14_PYRNV|nr:inositol-3-phosphate synthase [Pyrobaculum neutrophilum]ACB39677.1 Myo-inositol-1-phosphate synthase [Pyrobaculum neutrophilum V24Sta]
MPVRVGIVGVGNCASALVQGIEMYKQNPDLEPIVAFKEIGKYTPRDIVFTSAFEIDARKVGLDLADAIFQPPNNATVVFKPRKLGVTVRPGPALDGVPEGGLVPKIVEGTVDDVVKELNSTNTEVLVNYLPTGAKKAAEAYAEAALRAGVAFVNAMPAPIATSELWQRKFAERNLPLLGDDTQNQIGATVFHKTLVRLLAIRGVRIKHTYQINVGGTPDFVNLMYRRGDKEKTKTAAVKMMAGGQEFGAYISPVAYIEFLGDRKIAHTLIEAEIFGGLSIRIEATLDVHDAWNSAAVVTDSVRLAKLALDRGVGGPLISASAWGFKNPPVHMSPDEAYRAVVEFIEGKRSR